MRRIVGFAFVLVSKRCAIPAVIAHHRRFDEAGAIGVGANRKHEHAVTDMEARSGPMPLKRGFHGGGGRVTCDRLAHERA